MTEQRWTTKELVALRQQGDPLADPMIEEVFAAGGMPAIRAFNAFLQNFNAPIPDDVPASVRSYLEAPAPAPEWIDPAKLEQARGLFVIYALPTLLIFWTKSAAQCFAADNGSHTFYKQRVFNPTALRSFMVEITQLICDVMTEGGGWRSARTGQRARESWRSRSCACITPSCDSSSRTTRRESGSGLGNPDQLRRHSGVHRRLLSL